jgi:hypothetical protein
MINFQTNPMLADAIPAMSQQDSNLETKTVYKTYELDNFIQLDGNRQVNFAHVKRLVESVRENGFLLHPIIVNKKNQVIDGQHRLEAAKQLKTYVWVLVDHEATLKEAVAFNANTSDWGLKDYCKSYCDLGHKDYQDLMVFYENNKDFTMAQCAENTALKGGTMKDFKLGNFLYNPFHNVDIIFEALRKIHDVCPASKSNSYVRAIRVCINNKDFDINQFIKKFLMYPEQYRKSSHVSIVIANIEHIYNWKNHGKTRIILQSK